MAIVAVTRAPGIGRVLSSLGAHVVVPEHGSRPSVGEIAEGILAAGARRVIVLPNDRDAILAASQAVNLVPGVEVAIVPTRNAAEGIAAALASDAHASLVDNVAVMSEESSTLRSFRVITAARDSVVEGTAVHRGQVLAIDAAGHLLAAGSEVVAVTLKALATCEDFELVTLYVGAADDEVRADLRERIELGGFDAEVEIVDGGQPFDHLLVAVD
jgi:dihydroxyacetone kinase-like predicted kinase